MKSYLICTVFYKPTRYELVIDGEVALVCSSEEELTEKAEILNIVFSELVIDRITKNEGGVQCVQWYGTKEQLDKIIRRSQSEMNRLATRRRKLKLKRSRRPYWAGIVYNGKELR